MKSRLLLPDLSQEEEPRGEMQRRCNFSSGPGGDAADGIRACGNGSVGPDFFARGEPERFGYNSQTTYDINLFELLNAYGDHTHRSNIRTLHIQPSDLYSPSDVKGGRKIWSENSDWQDLSKFLPEELLRYH